MVSIDKKAAAISAAFFIGSMGLILGGAHVVERNRVFAIDKSNEQPPLDELLEPSYVDGFTHGQIGIFKQYNRIYPTLWMDVSDLRHGNPGKVNSVIAKSNPQIILNETECIVEMNLGKRVGERCVPY